MDVYRQQPVPVIYTQLPFVRHAANAILADLPEDLDRLHDLQAVACGERCVSTLESSHQFFVKCVFPDNILQRDGSTGDVIRWQYYHWKLWDAETFITDLRPAEAVSLEEAEADPSHLASIASDASCIPLLKKVQDVFDYGDYKGYTLSEDVEQDLRDMEARMVAALQLQRMKRDGKVPPATKKRSTRQATVTPALRDRVLRRDNYRCMFCGQKGPHTPIEANHIIPKSIITKLNLEASLVVAEENLCATCFKCNRGKSDNLAKEDIDFYIQAFAEPSHPNHGIVKFLGAVRRLQTLE